MHKNASWTVLLLILLNASFAMADVTLTEGQLVAIILGSIVLSAIVAFFVGALIGWLFYRRKTSCECKLEFLLALA